MTTIHLDSLVIVVNCVISLYVYVFAHIESYSALLRLLCSTTPLWPQFYHGRRRKQQALVAQRSSHKDKDAAHAQNRATCLGCTHLRAISRILDSLRPSVPWGDTGTIPRPIAMRKQACFPEGICELDCDTLNEPGSGSACFYINLWAMLCPSDHTQWYTTIQTDTSESVNS